MKRSTSIALIHGLFLASALVATQAVTPSASAQAKATPLDKSVQVVEQKDKIFEIFEDVVVVQRKAKDKRGSFLLNPGMTLDFSDGPTTLYTVNLNVGYAISDFFEAYVNFVPSFITQDRSIVKKLGEYNIQVKTAKPTAQYGVELLWLPAYGKDSWGPYSIVRSDTFFKFGYSMIQFDSGSGSRIALLVGKTYFLYPWFNLRVGAGLNMLETIVDGKKQSNPVAVIESGFMFYF